MNETEKSAVGPLPEKVLFRADTNRAGLTYIFAYHNKWDPVKRRAVRDFKRHVGRLMPDGRVRISPRFAADYPEFAGSDFFWDAEAKTIVEDPLVRIDFIEPRRPEPEPWPEMLEAECLSWGASWAAQKMAEKSGMLDDLSRVFGRTDAQNLLNLALYRMLSPGAELSLYASWQPGYWAEEPERLTARNISDLLNRITEERAQKFLRLRRDRCLPLSRKACPVSGDAELRTVALDVCAVLPSLRPWEPDSFDDSEEAAAVSRFRLTAVFDLASGALVGMQTGEEPPSGNRTLSEALASLRESGVSPEDMLLVTDCAVPELQRAMSGQGGKLRFLRRAGLAQEPVRRVFDENEKMLRESADLPLQPGLAARTGTDLPSGGKEDARPVLTHVYLDRMQQDCRQSEFQQELDEVIAAMNAGRSIFPARVRAFGRYVAEHRDRDGRTVRMRNEAAVQETLRRMGCFALRTNAVADPLAAFELLMLRSFVEMNFAAMQSDVEGDRMRATESLFRGKLFVNLLAASLKMQMHCAMRNAGCRNPEGCGPEASVTEALHCLCGLYIRRREGANCWVRDEGTEKQRSLLSALGLKLPSRILRKDPFGS